MKSKIETNQIIDGFWKHLAKSDSSSWSQTLLAVSVSLSPATMHPHGSGRFCLSLSHRRINSMALWAGCWLSLPGLCWKPSTGHQLHIWSIGIGFQPGQPHRPEVTWGGPGYTYVLPMGSTGHQPCPWPRVRAEGHCHEAQGQRLAIAANIAPCNWPVVVRGQGNLADGGSFLESG